MLRLQNRRDMISSSDAVDEESGRVLCSLESVGLTDALKSSKMVTTS